MSDTTVHLIDAASSYAHSNCHRLRCCHFSSFSTANRFLKFKSVEAQSRYLSAHSTIILINFQRSDKFAVIPLMKAAIIRGLSANLISKNERRVFSVIVEIVPINICKISVKLRSSKGETVFHRQARSSTSQNAYLIKISDSHGLLDYRKRGYAQSN